MNEISDRLYNIIGTCIIGGLSITLVFLNKKLLSWFSKKIRNITIRTHKFKEDSLDRDIKIREILIELRTMLRCDRTSVFQFHNGSVFSTKNPIWKISNTHESVSTGISSEIGNLQDIKASALIDVLQCFNDDKTLSGIECLSPMYCIDCANVNAEHIKRVLFITVDKLEDSYYKSLSIEEGIKYTLLVPIYNDNNCIGFVTANYCSDKDVKILKYYAKDICRHASQIQFILLD